MGQHALLGLQISSKWLYTPSILRSCRECQSRLPHRFRYSRYDDEIAELVPKYTDYDLFSALPGAGPGSVAKPALLAYQAIILRVKFKYLDKP
ncbi:MAG: hypothetical protein ACI9GW_000361 [Halieaceae bacterium]